MQFDTNNGTDDTSRYSKFEVIGFSTFRDMTSQKFPLQNGISYRNSILPHGMEQNSRKIIFMPENIFPGTNLYPPLTLHGFEVKQKVRMFNFSRCVISKPAAAAPPPPPPLLGESILLKFCQMCLIDKNKTSPSLDVLDRAVLELW